MQTNSQFHYPWPMMIEDSDRYPNDKKMITNLHKSMSRFDAFNKRNNHNAIAKKIQIVGDRALSISEEHHYAQTELSKRKILVELFKRTQKDGHDSKVAILLFMGIFEIVSSSFESETELLNEIRMLGNFYTNHSDDTTTWLKKIMRDHFADFRDRPSRLRNALSRRYPYPICNFDVEIAYVISFLESMEDSDLLGLLEPTIDLEIINDLLKDNQGSIKLFGEEYASLTEYAERLRIEKDRCWEIFYAQADKINKAIIFINEPIQMTEAICHQQNHLLSFLLFLHREGIMRQVSLQFPPPNKLMKFRVWKYPDEIINGFGKNELLILGSSPQYWFIVLLQILTHSGGIINDRITNGVIPLLVELIKHPKKIRKAKSHQSLDKTKAVLAKHIAPCLIGYHNVFEEALYDIEMLSSLPGREVIHIFANYITKAHANYLKRPDLYKHTQQKVEKKILTQIIAPHFDKILLLFCQALQSSDSEKVTSLDDLELRFLESSLYEEDICDAENLEIEEINDSIFEEWKTDYDWSYVSNLRQGITDAEKLPSDSDGKLKALKSIFRKFKNKQAVGIKTESILRALKYFEGMASTLQKLLPVEIVGGKPWVKLKRGKVRILVRIEKESQLLFHVFPRKEWKFGMFLKSH